MIARPMRAITACLIISLLDVSIATRGAKPASSHLWVRRELAGDEVRRDRRPAHNREVDRALVKLHRDVVHSSREA